MRLTTFTDYSLRVMMYVAAHPEGRATIGEIAKSYDISEHHLTKVVHFLGRTGLIETVRGKGGGFSLAQPAAEIVLGDVVRQTEGAAVPAECFDADGGHCLIAAACHLKGVLQEAVEAFYVVLDGYTLADLVRNRDELAAVMFVQRRPVPPARATRPKA